MSLFSRRTPAEQTTLQKQGGRVLADVRETALQLTTHLEALTELFRLELKEYGARQARRAAFLVAGVFLLLCAYLMLCAVACVLLSDCVGWLWATVSVCLFNVVLGCAGLLVAAKCKPGSVAPATVQEIKDDVQCIRIMLRGNEKS